MAKRDAPSPQGRRRRLGAVLALLLTAGATGFFWLGSRLSNDPYELVSAFAGAIRRKSVSALAATVSAPELPLSQSTLAPLFRLAEEADGAALADLERSLLAQATGVPPPAALDAVTLEWEPVLLVFRRWRVVLHPVELALETDAPGCFFVLNGEAVSGRVSLAESSRGLMPGCHDVRVRYVGYGMEASSPVHRLPCLSRRSRAMIAFPDLAAAELPGLPPGGQVRINGFDAGQIPANGRLALIALRGMRLAVEQEGNQVLALTVEDPRALGQAARKEF